jgi:arabinofuranan 3-O-arabinosyltransferase
MAVTLEGESKTENIFDIKRHEFFRRPYTISLFFLIWLVAFIVFLFQAPGREIFDTKLELVADPTTLLSSLTNLWDPTRYFGVLQDQYIGYAWPMGPFFSVFYLLKIPMWIAERLWESLVFALAAFGLTKLAEEFSIGTRQTRLLAGLIFALWPTFTSLIGSTSGAILPGVLLPLALLPLVKASKSGSPLKGALYSGLVIMSMGGINATSTLDGFILIAVFFITRKFSPRMIALMLWWILIAVAAIFWWLLPLLYLGAYGFNFLPYVEQAHTTFSTMSATEVLRGMGDWTSYLDFGFYPHTDIVVLGGAGNPNPSLDFPHPWIIGGWILATNPIVIFTNCLLVGVGLYALCKKDMPERLMLLITFAIGVVFTLSGYWGNFGGPFSGILQHIFDGPLAPLRNVYKFEPMMAVCLCLALAHAFYLIDSNIRKFWKPGWLIRRSTAANAALFILVGPMLIPYGVGNVLEGGSFTKLPDYWVQAANYIYKVSPHNPVLMVPAADQGVYVWGTPVDEPLEALSKSPWTALDQVPFGGAGSKRLLDEIELVFKGEVVPSGFQAYLSRAGIYYILVRNDLDWRQADDPSPAQVHSVLSQLGFYKVAGFGPMIPSQDYITATLDGTLAHSPPKYQAVEIYQSSSLLGKNASLYPVVTLNASDTAVVSGGPGSILNLLSSGLISENQPVILEGNWNKNLPAKTWIETDTLQRVQVNFGILNDNKSYVLTPSDNAPLGSPGGEGGQPVRQILPFKGIEHQTVAQYVGVKNITASSYGSWYFSEPQNQPYAAFDGNPNTAWITGSSGSPIGQWIKVDLNKPINVPFVSVQMLADNNPLRPVANSLTVTTSAGSITTDVENTNLPQELSVAPGKTDFIKITIASVSGGIPGGPGVGIREISVPGVNPLQLLVMPHETGVKNIGRDEISMQSDLENPDVTAGAPYPPLNRQFFLYKSGSFSLRGTVMPIPGPALTQLLSPNSQIQIYANSTFANLPRFAAINLLDPHHNSAWIANGPNPTLVMTWPQKTVINQMKLFFTSNFAARPEVIKIQSLEGTRTMKVPDSGVINFSPLDTDAIEITFPKVQKLISVNQLTGQIGQLPVGLAGINIPAIRPYEPQFPSTDSPVTLPCGEGPSFQLDGSIVQTAVNGTYGDLINPGLLNLSICNPLKLELSAGSHTVITLPSGSPFAINSLAIAPRFVNITSNTQSNFRNTSVVSWGSQNIQINVGNGQKTYLVLHQNYNLGWRAQLNGIYLKPVVIDGWQQGFIIPKGQYGVIDLSYVPNFLYQVGLGVGFGALIIIVIASILAFFGKLKRKEDSFETSVKRQEFADWIWLIIATAILFLIGSIAAIIPPVISYITWIVTQKYQKDIRGWLAFMFISLAGIISATSIGLNASSHTGAFGNWAQLFAMSAISALVVRPTNWFGKVLEVFAPIVYWTRRRSQRAIRNKYEQPIY